VLARLLFVLVEQLGRAVDVVPVHHPSPCKQTTILTHLLLLLLLLLYAQMGLKKQDLIDIVALGAIASPMFALKGPAMAKANYPPGNVHMMCVESTVRR
jgi:hypothetical protein